MPWYDKAEMLAIWSNHTGTHHYTMAEFAAAQYKHIREQSGSWRAIPSAPVRDRYSTVTLFARLRGLSTSVPRAQAV